LIPHNPILDVFRSRRLRLSGVLSHQTNFWLHKK
jgi:hypothetical protein